jgi:hypothetical protein
MGRLQRGAYGWQDSTCHLLCLGLLSRMCHEGYNPLVTQRNPQLDGNSNKTLSGRPKGVKWEVSLRQKLFKPARGLGPELKRAFGPWPLPAAFNTCSESSSLWLIFSQLPLSATILVICPLLFVSAAQCHLTPPLSLIS